MAFAYVESFEMRKIPAKQSEEEKEEDRIQAEQIKTINTTNVRAKEASVTCSTDSAKDLGWKIITANIP